MAKWRIVRGTVFFPFRIQRKGGWWPFWVTKHDSITMKDAADALAFFKEYDND